jgi:hypothetical protein
MIELIEVPYFNKATSFTGKILLSVIEEYGNCSISIDEIGSLESPTAFKGPDLFFALTLLRFYLEKQDIYLLCCGARIDVYPSGMNRDMSNGRVACVTRIGEFAEIEDLVEIFSPANFSEIGSVADQKAFHQKWIDSLEAD